MHTNHKQMSSYVTKLHGQTVTIRVYTPAVPAWMTQDTGTTVDTDDIISLRGYKRAQQINRLIEALRRVNT